MFEKDHQANSESHIKSRIYYLHFTDLHGGSHVLIAVGVEIF